MDGSVSQFLLKSSFVPAVAGKNVLGFGSLLLSCTSAFRTVLSLLLLNELSQKCLINCLQNSAVLFHEETREDLNFYFLILIFVCLLFWLSYSLLTYYSICLLCTQFSRGTGQGRPWLSHAAACVLDCSIYILLQTAWLLANPWRSPKLILFSSEFLRSLKFLSAVSKQYGLQLVVIVECRLK